jgi:hypothetical protein
MYFYSHVIFAVLQGHVTFPLIQRMIAREPADRPRIQEVVQELERLGAN